MHVLSLTETLAGGLRVVIESPAEPIGCCRCGVLASSPQDTPLALLAGNSHYLALDGLGSPVALINHDGGQTGSYAYDPYGGTTATAVNGSGAIGIQIYGYAAGITDPTSTLVHYRHALKRPRFCAASL